MELVAQREEETAWGQSASAHQGVSSCGVRKRSLTSVFDRRLTDDGSRSGEPTGRADPQTSRAGGGSRGRPCHGPRGRSVGLQGGASVQQAAWHLQTPDWRSLARSCPQKLRRRIRAVHPRWPGSQRHQETSIASLQVERLPMLSPSLQTKPSQWIVRAIPGWSRPREVYVFGARLSVSPKLETPDVKLSELFVAEHRDAAVHDQLLLRDGLVASVANLAVGGITPESCHAR
jgi:hypothetical protein